jgi:hypothetical protein
MQSLYEFEIAPDYPVLNAYVECRDRVSIIRGPLGSGKTVGSCQRLLKQMGEQAPNPENVRLTRWIAVRNTYGDLMGTTIKDFMEVFEGLGVLKKGGAEPPNFTANYEDDQGVEIYSEVIFLALDRPESVKRLRGYQCTGFWLNETKELSKAVVDMADLRHGRYPSIAAGGVTPTWHGMFGDTNSPDEDHYLYELAEETKPKDWTFFNQPGGLIRVGSKFEINPLAENIENLPEGYYIRGMEGKKEDWIKVNLANEYGFVLDGKPVHPQYNDSIHCAEDNIKPVKGLDIIMGLDFGRTPAAAFWQKLPIGRWVCFDEYTSNDMSAATFAPELKRYIDANYSGYKFKNWGDPAGDRAGEATDDTPYKILADHGIKARPTKTNAPLIRRSALANPMLRNCMDGKPAFLLSPKCKMIRKGLMGGFCYKRVQVSGERYKDEPDKNIFSHPVEAAEYALQGEGEGRIEKIGGKDRKPKRYRPSRVQ